MRNRLHFVQYLCKINLIIHWENMADLNVLLLIKTLYLLKKKKDVSITFPVFLRGNQS